MKMKLTYRLRSAVLALIFSALVNPASGESVESRYRAHISVGGHAGWAMSQMSFSPSVSQKWHNGITIGATFRYQEEKLFGLIGELNFVQRGWVENIKGHPEMSYKRTLNYLTLPIMTHISFGSRRFKGFVNLGPEVGVMLSDNISSNFDYRHPYDADVPSNRQTEQMWADISSRLDYGITAGLGGEYYLTPRQSVTLEVRFYYGLGNIYPSAKADTFSASRSMTLAATLGYNFRLK